MSLHTWPANFEVCFYQKRFAQENSCSFTGGKHISWEMTLVVGWVYVISTLNDFVGNRLTQYCNLHVYLMGDLFNKFEKIKLNH